MLSASAIATGAQNLLPRLRLLPLSRVTAGIELCFVMHKTDSNEIYS